MPRSTMGAVIGEAAPGVTTLSIGSVMAAPEPPLQRTPAAVVSRPATSVGGFVRDIDVVPLGPGEAVKRVACSVDDIDHAEAPDFWAGRIYRSGECSETEADGTAPLKLRSALRDLAIGAAVAVALMAAPARAGAESYPFSIFVVGPDKVGITCKGPASRSSACKEIPAGSTRTVFYVAESGIISAIGDWSCVLTTGCGGGRQIDSVGFCGPGAGNSPKEVELTARSNVAVKMYSNQASSCFGTPVVARSILGQTGEADATPAQDTDTYRFAGEAGEKVEVGLDRDGSTGSLGAVATLRLRAKGGAVLGEETGPVPLRLKATLPGEVEVVVLRDAKSGNPLRGGYALELKPASGELDGRALRPTENVEG